MINKLLKNKVSIFTILIILSVSLYLVQIWLPNGEIIAGADVGTPNLYPQKQLEDVSSSWWDRHGTGISSPTTYTSVSYYAILSIFEKMGMGPDITQKIVFFTILVGGAISIYFIALLFSFNKWVALVCSLFYIFNLTSLSVWQRGIHNAMLMLLLAPSTLLINIIGVKKRKYYFLIILNIVSFLLSYVYGALGYLVALWLLWVIFLLTMLVLEWKDAKSRKFILIYTILLLISWLGTNLFWILNLLSSGTYNLSQFSSDQLRSSSADVLQALKQYHEPEIILRGLSRFYHYTVKDWGEIYLQPSFILLSWLPTLIIFSTAIFKSNQKSIYWRFLFILTIIILTISKGVNSPFGLLNKLSYDYIPALAPLRNPYEKVGILLTIPYSLLFGLGLYNLIIFFKAQKFIFLRIIIIAIFVFSITVLVWPLWKGQIFTSEGKKYAVTFPQYYFQAKDWMDKNNDDTRILQLPLAPGESVDYNWDYSGIEPSQNIFSQPSIGYNLGIPFVDSRITNLIVLIHNHDTESIKKSLASLNVGWVIVHNEIEWRDRNLEPVDRINQWLATKPDFLEHKIDIGPLSIWRVKDSYRLGHFFSTDKIVNIGQYNDQASINIWDYVNNFKNSFLIGLTSNQQQKLSPYESSNIITPNSKIQYTDLGFVNTDAALKEIASVHYLPGTLIYPLIELKENISNILQQNDVIINCFDTAGKRLLESSALFDQNKIVEAENNLLRYQKQLKICQQIDKGVINGYLSSDSLKPLIVGQLVRQRAILESEFNQSPIGSKVNEVKLTLGQLMSDLGISPKYSLINKPKNDQRVVVFTYFIPVEGEFSIKLDHPNEDVQKNPPIVIQIDDQSANRNATKVSNKGIEYNSIHLNEGYHEIFLQLTESRNLIADSIKAKALSPDIGFSVNSDWETSGIVFTGNSTNDPVTLSFDLNNIEIDQKYQVNLFVYTSQGNPPFFSIISDTERLDGSGNPKPATAGLIKLPSYPISWQPVGVFYSPLLNSTSARINLTLFPWNDCPPNINSTPCKYQLFSNGISHASTAMIKDVSVNKIFGSNLDLEMINQNEKLGSVNISSKKNSSVLYHLNLDNQQPPYIIIFSETFSPFWQIVDPSGKVLDLLHFPVDSFANGWLVKDKLPADIKVEFVLQRKEFLGIILSTMSFISLVFITIILDRRRKNDV